MMLVGSTKDGVFARPPLGVFVHPTKKIWSTKPFNREQSKILYEYRKEGKRISQLISLGIDSFEAVENEVNKIKLNKSTIPKRLREYLLQHWNWINK